MTLYGDTHGHPGCQICLANDPAMEAALCDVNLGAGDPLVDAEAAMNERELFIALIDSLPRCRMCAMPAMREHRRGGPQWCDEHGAPHGAHDLCYAPALRTIITTVKR